MKLDHTPFIAIMVACLILFAIFSENTQNKQTFKAEALEVVAHQVDVEGVLIKVVSRH